MDAVETAELAVRKRDGYGFAGAMVEGVGCPVGGVIGGLEAVEATEFAGEGDADGGWTVLDGLDLEWELGPGVGRACSLTVRIGSGA